MSSGNPNVSLEFVECSFYQGRIAFKDVYHKKRIKMLAVTLVEFNYKENLAKIFIIPASHVQFIQENIFDNATVRRIAVAMNTNSAFTGSYNEIHFWYQRFDFKRTRILRQGQPVVFFDATDNRC